MKRKMTSAVKRATITCRQSRQQGKSSTNGRRRNLPTASEC
jgi:hypothetical protein